MVEFNVADRARQSAGKSAAVVHEAALAMLIERDIYAHTFLDVGCGTGSLCERVKTRCEHYIGTDAVRHEGFPANLQFVQADFDAGKVALPDGVCDVVACIETIEHVENPRALM